jgi:iron complex outermembrane receptor protein
MELDAPVLKNLEIDAAVRYDKYSGGSNSTTPKVGFKFAPMKEVTMRGTYTKGFRAPNPAESGSAGQSFFFNTYQDPILCPNNGPDLTKVPGNFPQQCQVALTGVQLTNKNLQPEKSKSYTFGLILEPTKHFSVSTDFYQVEIDNQIISAQSDPTYNPFNYLVRGTPLPQPMVLPDGTLGTGTPSVGNILYVPYPYENAQYTKTSGVDIDGRWTLDLQSAGKLTTELTVTHVFKYEQSMAGGAVIDLAGTHGPSGVSGDTGNPKDRAQLVLTWDRGPLAVSGTVNWIGRYSVIDPTSAGTSTCDGAVTQGSGAFTGSTPKQYCTVDSFTTLDLYGSYQMDKHWKFHASVLNVFNQQPPIDLQTYGGAAATFYNPALHQAGAVGRFFNIGATYTF